MKLKKLKTRNDYHAALARFEEIFQAKKGTSESDEADVLSLLIEDYEERHFVVNAPGPLEAIRYRMEQQGLSASDLSKILGHRSRVSDIFRKTRRLNLQMVRKLHRSLRIPLETLIRDY
jgi:HTH-type transcriptional regulator/antitoxin HigA